MPATVIQLPPHQLPRFDELYAISDLHMGGQGPSQIFNCGPQLAAFIDYVRLRDAKTVALVINGDLVDFLAEPNAMAFDPGGAIGKLDRIVADVAFAKVWEALRKFVKAKERRLVITLGNHDLELALPWVREHLVSLLTNHDERARARLTLAFEGEGFLCRVGNATVLCIHGNEVDDWNVADHEAIRRLARDVQQGGKCPESFAHLFWAERHPSLAQAVMAPFMCWSFNSSMLRYRFVDHAVPATCRSLAAARLRADWPSGNAPTTRVRRLISRSSRSSGLLVRIRRQCSSGKA
jgi:UDP-2,3-diacylglucosamine pyrophosphatase LpxH